MRLTCILALGSGERLMYLSNRVRTANPVSVRIRVMVSASLSSAAVESPVLIEIRQLSYITACRNTWCKTLQNHNQTTVFDFLHRSHHVVTLTKRNRLKLAAKNWWRLEIEGTHTFDPTPTTSYVAPPSEYRWIAVLVCKMNLLTLWPWPLTF